MPSAHPPKVALLIEMSNAYARGVLRGIEDYIRTHGPWSVYLAEHGRGDRPPSWLPKWEGHGIIARIENRGIARAVASMSVPVVDVSAARLIPEAPWVETDDHAIAELAAQHFLERGFRTFAYVGESRFNWSKWRGHRFAEILRSQGFPCYMYQGQTRPVSSEENSSRLVGWLMKLPKPLAIFACYDACGQQVLDGCRRAGLNVPEQVAVLGVDNDELLCDLSPPPLSSIIPNARRTGWEAAELLAQRMRGEAVGSESRRIPPLGIATRQSTDVTAAEDVHVGRAARFIRENSCRGISVANVVAAVPLGRRQLERRFRSLLGHTLREEIANVKVARVKELLAGSDLSLAEIAYRAGFKHAEYLTVVFKRETGQTPSAYRAEHRPREMRTVGSAVS